MRILCDTNILIYREDYRILSEDLAHLLQIIEKLGWSVVIHPLSIWEITQDSDKMRQEIALSKIAAYPILQDPPNPKKDEEFIRQMGIPSSSNDEVDNALIFAVLRNCVNSLVTEDKGIHSKASRIGIDNRVLSIREALDLYGKSLPNIITTPTPALQHLPIYKLNIEDPIFDSLKGEYDGFVDWWERSAAKERMSWVNYHGDGSLGALLVYKFESDPIQTTKGVLPSASRLKICTLKVERTGYKIGELLIRIAVEICMKNNLPEMYLTHFTKEQDTLVPLIEKYGFTKVGEKRTGGQLEDVFLKRLIPPDHNTSLSPVELSRIFYPSFFDGPIVRKYVVPIRPLYHERLFIDQEMRQSRLDEFDGEFQVEANAIEKAYLCHSNIKAINSGDILLFYKSRDSELTSLGVVENATHSITELDALLDIIGKRSVYTIKELEAMLKKPTLAILFRHHFHLQNPLHISELRRIYVLKQAPQTIQGMKHDAYLRVKEKGGLDVRYTVH